MKSSFWRSAAVISMGILTACTPASGLENTPEKEPDAITAEDVQGSIISGPVLSALFEVNCKDGFYPDHLRTGESGAQFGCMRPEDGATYGMIGARVVEFVDDIDDSSLAYYEVHVDRQIESSFPPIVTNASRVAKVHMQGADVVAVDCVAGLACGVNLAQSDFELAL